MQEQIQEAMIQVVNVLSSITGEVPEQVKRVFDEMMENPDLSEAEREHAQAEMVSLEETYKELSQLCKSGMQSKAKLTFQMFQAYQENGFTEEQALALVTHNNFEMSL